MANDNGDVVDLTKSFTLVDHCNIADEVIVIDTDDSFETSNVRKNKSNKLKSSGGRKLTRKSTPSTNEPCVTKLKRTNKFGSCPICWEDFGTNALASTKCGHVFCLKCIEQSLKIEKRCPNCRIPLKGSSAYHRLYLSI